MSQIRENDTLLDDMRAQIDAIDARLHDALMERVRLAGELQAACRAKGQSGLPVRPDWDADTMRQRVEAHQGELPLVEVEHIWRSIMTASSGMAPDHGIHLDGLADPVGMLDLARFHFGYTATLLPAGDPPDVIAAVAASRGDLGVIALEDRADLPWWRGLSATGAQIIARLPMLVLDEHPADLPALVVSRSVPDRATADIATYDARWSDRLPGRLMDQGVEVLSFHRSAQGVDALLAVSADLSEDAVRDACREAGAEPEVLRLVGGYWAPIDVDGDADEDFGSDDPDPSDAMAG